LREQLVHHLCSS